MHNHPCPSCGYCPCCGRGGARVAPVFVPYFPWTTTGGGLTVGDGVAPLTVGESVAPLVWDRVPGTNLDPSVCFTFGAIS